MIANDVTSLTVNIHNAEVFAKLISEDSLSAEDQLRLIFMYALDLHNREFEYFQFKNGLLYEQTWLLYQQIILINNSADHGLIWWDQIGREIVDPEFGNLVDELLIDAQPIKIIELMATLADK